MVRYQGTVARWADRLIRDVKIESKSLTNTQTDLVFSLFIWHVVMTIKIKRDGIKAGFHEIIHRDLEF